MRLREHSSAVLLWLAALVLALLAGVAIPLLGGRSSGPSATDWTPPPTATTPVVAPQFTATPAPSRVVRTIEPLPTATPAASATALPKLAVAPTATPAARRTALIATPTTGQAAAPSAQALARIVQGPANLRAGAGTTFTVLATAKSGDQFDITGRSEDGAWVRLCCVAGAPVWVSAELVELPRPIETLPVVR
jgi:hypothetical protein